MNAPQDGGPKARYFYRDSLAAAWMMEYFGMRLVDSENQDIWLDSARYSQGGLRTYFCSKPAGERASFLHPELTFKIQQKAYIHPDSLPLLEPVNGDLARFAVCDARGDHIEYRSFNADDDPGIRIEDWFRIIERDGKAFMWPESEPA